MEKTQTRTGLRVVVDILDRVYEIGKKVAEDVKKKLHIVRDTLLPLWNYQILPKIF